MYHCEVMIMCKIYELLLRLTISPEGAILIRKVYALTHSRPNFHRHLKDIQHHDAEALCVCCFSVENLCLPLCTRHAHAAHVNWDQASVKAK